MKLIYATLVLLFCVNYFVSAQNSEIKAFARSDNTHRYSIIFDKMVWDAKYNSIAEQNQMDIFLVQKGRNPEDANAVIMTGSFVEPLKVKPFDKIVERDIANMQRQSPEMTYEIIQEDLNIKNVIEYKIIIFRSGNQTHKAYYLRSARTIIFLIFAVKGEFEPWEKEFEKIINELVVL